MSHVTPSAATLGLMPVLKPSDAQDGFTAWMLEEGSFIGAKRLDDGTYVGVLPLLFTVVICVGVSENTSYDRRYCYDSLTDCLQAFQELATGNDQPSGWVATRP